MMPWGRFIVALLAVYVAQTAAVTRLAPAWIDLLVTLALVCGLAAPLPEARLAGWLTGFMQDVGSSGPIGLNALAGGLAVLLLTRLREQANLQLWWVRWLIALLAALPAQLLVRCHERYLQGAATSWWGILGSALITSAVAALLAALVVGLPRVWSARRRRRMILRF